MTPSEYAQLYCALGWMPIPMLPRTKRPARKYIHLNDAQPPFDPLGYCGPWAGCPDLGIAILLKPSGLMVIDCDSLSALEEVMCQSPPTWTVVTRQGAHLYYRNPTGKAVRAIHRGASGKVDVLSNGYVIAPPSIHPCGHMYGWANQSVCEHLPDAPEWACKVSESARCIDTPTVTVEAAQALFANPTPPIDWVRVRAVNPKVHALLAHGHQPGEDRSLGLWLTINCLVRLRCTDEQIVQTIWNSGAGEKPRQKGVQWLAGEVARARLELQPEPKP